jgi:hypothetical protein
VASAVDPPTEPIAPQPHYRGSRPGPDWAPPQSSGKDWVAIILAIGMSTAINLFIVGVWIADYSAHRPLSQQSSLVLTTVFGGIIGILGSYIGYRAGSKAADAQAQRDQTQVGLEIMRRDEADYGEQG